MPEKKRILTGDRTTGKLHLGHYVGSLQSRVKLQEEYESFILLADIQALTTHFENPELLEHSIYEVAMDNLSVGLDPNKITLVQQSLDEVVGLADREDHLLFHAFSCEAFFLCRCRIYKAERRRARCSASSLILR